MRRSGRTDGNCAYQEVRLANEKITDEQAMPYKSTQGEQLYKLNDSGSDCKDNSRKRKTMTTMVEVQSRLIKR